MSVQFSAEGPAFPEQLVDALLSGDVVFLCGAGVSAPHLLQFGPLVDACFKRLHMEKSASEEQSFKEGRFEEVLGSLSRRIVDPVDVTRAVVAELQTPSNADLSQHRTILRLSRNLENQPVIVTTNFDTMLEQSLLESEKPDQVRRLSFAGQDLPSPGSAGFGGIIHLHGRIAEPEIGLEETPLVLTSADYGDAYLRSGWASRFLFDLCRCKTLVLVGYSAGDAPVRYILNVLEADRQRFPDLHPVYALDSVTERGTPDARWSALAVTPVAYIAPKKNDHSALWRDLAKLAEIVELPRTTRRDLAQDILSKPLDGTSPADRECILWVLRGNHDLWPIAITSIEDDSWFDFIFDQKVWSHQDVAWLLAAWLARDFQSADRIEIAIKWSERLDKQFGDAITNRLRQAKELPELWLRAWRLLALSHTRRDSSWAESAHAIEERLRGPVVLNADIQKAVELLTPQFKLSHRGESAVNPPNRLDDLFWTRWPVEDQHGALELVHALVAVRQPAVIMEMATAKLQEVVRNMIDLDAINDDFDRSDSAVPSVEPHEQNAHRDGLAFLVQLLALLLPEVARMDSATGRYLAEAWRRMSCFLGARLWLHALRTPDLFTSDEAVAGLEALPFPTFWHVRRELALVLSERTAGANPELVARLEQRILTEGEAYYQRYTIDEGQVDWRGHARDAEVWLRLKMLALAGTLSEAGAFELAAIKQRREYLDREVGERDYFRSWSSGVRTVVGDAQPILEAEAGERLAVAHDLIRNPDLSVQMGWSAYCRTDPRGAFDTLSHAELDASNAPLWGSLIDSLSFPQGQRDDTLNRLVISIFEMLRPAPGSFRALIIRSLANLYLSAPRQAAPEIVTWWPQLFALAVTHDTQPLDASRDLYEDAINSPGGQLTEALLADIDQRRESGEPIEVNMLDALSHAAVAQGRQGAYARAVLVRYSAFVLSIDGQAVAGELNNALAGGSADAAALRAVLVHRASLYPTVSSTFSAHILRGVTEVDSHRPGATHAAAKIIAPALAIIRQQDDCDSWGIALKETRWALRKGSPALRRAAAEVLWQGIHEIGDNPAEAWRNGIGPLHFSIWPRDRELCEKELTFHFTKLAVASADAFPDALKQLLLYLTRLDGYGGLHAITQSTAPEAFPMETLDLLWRLCGPGCTADLYDIPQLLERMIAVRPAIERDRRLQWLNQRAVRYE